MPGLKTGIKFRGQVENVNFGVLNRVRILGTGGTPPANHEFPGILSPGISTLKAVVRPSANGSLETDINLLCRGDAKLITPFLYS